MKMYKCIKDFVMNNGDIAFTKGMWYAHVVGTSENTLMTSDKCLVPNGGKGHHSGIDIDVFYDHFIEYRMKRMTITTLNVVTENCED